MDFKDIIPYYSDIQLARLLACSYVAGGVSVLTVFLLSRLGHLRLGFERVAAFCFIASGVLWLMPLVSHIPGKYINYFLLGTVFLFLPLIKVFYEQSWPQTFLFWLVFSLTQFGFYIYMINS